MMDKVHELVKKGKIILELFQELEEVIGNDQGVTGIKIKSNKDQSIKEIKLQKARLQTGKAVWGKFNVSAKNTEFCWLPTR